MVWRFPADKCLTPSPIRGDFMNRISRSGLLLVLCAGGLGSPFRIQAQTPPANADLETELMALLNTPVTTATRTAQSSSKAPATLVTVTAEQIQKRKYRSLAEVLRDLPEFKVDNGFSSESYNSVSVRGIQGQNKFVILLDGARIGAAGNETIPILENFPVHFAKQIEVVYGPASALYGADAFTGIINIVTWKGEEAAAHSSFRAALGDNNQRDLALFWSGDLGAGTALSLGAQNFSDDMPNLPQYYPEAYQGLDQALNTGVFNTAFGPKTATLPYDKKFSQPIRANNLFLRLQKDSWSIALFQAYTNVPSVLTYTAPNALPNPSSHIAVRTLGVTANQLSQVTEALSIQSTLTARTYEVDPASAFVNLFEPNMEPGYKYAASNSFRLEEVVNWQASRAWSLTTGLSFEVMDATPWSADLATPVDTGKSISSQGILMPGTPFTADFYTIRSHSRGLFAQAQFAPNDQWAATLGGRWDDDSRYGSSFNPRLGLVWTPTSTTTLKMMYGTAFLAPSPYAAFRHYGNFFSTDGGATYQSSYWHLPNPGLKPEKAETLELSFRTLLTGSLSLTANVYQSTYKDLHTLMPDSGHTNLYGDHFKGWPVGYLEVTGNQGKQVNTGGNLQLDYLVRFGAGGKVNAFLSHGRVDGKVEDDRGLKADIGDVTPVMTRLGFDFAMGPWSLSPVLLVMGAQRSNTLRGGSTQRQEVAGYRELNLVGGFAFSPRWEVFLRVNNALDARYRSLNENAFANTYEFQGVPQSPRRIALGIRGHF